jgi:anti-anti-sigma factor
MDTVADTARVLRAQGDLTLTLAPALCRAISDALAAGATRLTIDLRDVKSADVVGLATLLQANDVAARANATLTVVAEDSLRDAVLAAHLLDEIPLVTGGADPLCDVEDVETPRVPAEPLLAETERIGLRRPAWDELALFGRWAEE